MHWVGVRLAIPTVISLLLDICSVNASQTITDIAGGISSDSLATVLCGHPAWIPENPKEKLRLPTPVSQRHEVFYQSAWNQLGFDGQASMIVKRDELFRPLQLKLRILDNREDWKSFEALGDNYSDGLSFRVFVDDKSLTNNSDSLRNTDTLPLNGTTQLIFLNRYGSVQELPELVYVPRRLRGDVVVEVFDHKGVIERQTIPFGTRNMGFTSVSPEECRADVVLNDEVLKNTTVILAGLTSPDGFMAVKRAVDIWDSCLTSVFGSGSQQNYVRSIGVQQLRPDPARTAAWLMKQVYSAIDSCTMAAKVGHYVIVFVVDPALLRKEILSDAGCDSVRQATLDGTYRYLGQCGRDKFGCSLAHTVFVPVKVSQITSGAMQLCAKLSVADGRSSTLINCLPSESELDDAVYTQIEAFLMERYLSVTTDCQLADEPRYSLNLRVQLFPPIRRDKAWYVWTNEDFAYSGRNTEQWARINVDSASLSLSIPLRIQQAPSDGPRTLVKFQYARSDHYPDLGSSLPEIAVTMQEIAVQDIVTDGDSLWKHMFSQGYRFDSLEWRRFGLSRTLGCLVDTLQDGVPPNPDGALLTLPAWQRWRSGSNVMVRAGWKFDEDKPNSPGLIVRLTAIRQTSVPFRSSLRMPVKLGSWVAIFMSALYLFLLISPAESSRAIKSLPLVWNLLSAIVLWLVPIVIGLLHSYVFPELTISEESIPYVMSFLLIVLGVSFGICMKLRSGAVAVAVFFILGLSIASLLYAVCDYSLLWQGYFGYLMMAAFILILTAYLYTAPPMPLKEKQ